MTSVVILYNTPIISGYLDYDFCHHDSIDIIRVAGWWLLPSYDNIETWSGYLDYDFCRHIILYTDYLCSWIMTSVVKWQYRHDPDSWMMTSAVIWQYRHDPGSWITTSAVILYYTSIIRVAGLRLLLSYYTIHPLSGLRLLPSYYTIHPLSG